ncbi:fibronectin type III domain-containing protein [Hyphomicrobium sp.]|uniref:fibronectin type III domain-containing protein n=1 Tax=Hyphomicrobium sp. TaxID=82 RepID=UPI00345DECB7
MTYTPVVSPDAPTNLLTTSIVGGVSLSWAAPASSGSSGITSYKIYRNTTSPATTLLATETSTTTATHSDTSAVHGTVYYYRVTAVNAAGESDYSNQRASGSNSGRIIRLGGMRLH